MTKTDDEQISCRTRLNRQDQAYFLETGFMGNLPDGTTPIVHY
jgi:hypothetical protein